MKRLIALMIGSVVVLVAFSAGYLVGNMHALQRQWAANLHLYVAHYAVLEAGDTAKLNSDFRVLISGLYQSVRSESHNPLFYLEQRPPPSPVTATPAILEKAKAISAR